MHCRWCRYAVAPTVERGGLTFRLDESEQLAAIRRHTRVAHPTNWRALQAYLNPAPVGRSGHDVPHLRWPGAE
jgi:hypothetical protein